MTTFISYSRDNSDFALRLARDLRAAGLDIWLDQLDIRTGTRWDDEVEKALEKSTTFLIVLTPESIQSQNVKDEIGYAIDAGKHILPIILKPCNVPFRLRRFQYVDFSNKPYDESFTEIKHLLTNTNELARAKNDGEDYVPIEKPGRQLTTKILVGLVGAIVIALAVILPGTFSKPSDDHTLTPNPVFSSETFTPIPPTETLEPSLPATEIVTSAFTPLPAEITDAKGVQMVLVPEGEFTMGSENDDDERPVHTVYLDDFYVDIFEVTNSLYKACVAVNACDKPKDTSKYNNSQYANHPVVFVDWNMAQAYCEWRSAKLPTESQWEKAARGTDARIYPWGTSIDTTFANYLNIIKDTSDVESYENGRSVYGVYNLAGNVWEWVADRYDADYYYTLSAIAINPPGPTSGNARVMRGGSWNDDDNDVRSSNRAGLNFTASGHDLGFRCAKDANP